MKSRKYLFIVLLIIVLAIIGIMVRIKSSDINASNVSVVKERNDVASSKNIAVTLTSIEGTVQFSEKNDDKWTDAVSKQNVPSGSSIKTIASKAVLSIDQDNWLVIDEYSMITIRSVAEKEIKIEQVYCKTYSTVKTKVGQTYSIIKDKFTITSLGTEFIVIIPDNYQTIEVRVYKNKVSYSQGQKKGEISESNKMLYTVKDLTFNALAMNDEEKRQSTNYVALIDKAKVLAQESQSAATSSKSVNADTNSSTSSDQASSGTQASSSSSSTDSTNSTSSASDPSSASSPTPSSDSSSSNTSNDSQTQPTVPENQPDNTPAQTIFGEFSDTSVESVVNSLQLVYNDATGDYVTPDGAPPAGVYEYPPIDTDNLYMGIRDGRLYLKITFAGTIPTSQQTVGDNRITSLSYNIGIDNDDDLLEGCGSGAETHLQMNIEYHDDGQIWYNPWFNANCLSGEGEHSEVYETIGNGLAHTYNSGLGKTSIVFSYALSDLADTISLESNLNVTLSSEAESNLWHHYSYDQDMEFGEPVWADWTAAEI